MQQALRCGAEYGADAAMDPLTIRNLWPRAVRIETHGGTNTERLQAFEISGWRYGLRSLQGERCDVANMSHAASPFSLRLDQGIASPQLHAAARNGSVEKCRCWRKI